MHYRRYQSYYEEAIRLIRKGSSSFLADRYDKNIYYYVDNFLQVAASSGNVKAMEILINYRKADPRQAILNASTADAVRLLYRYGVKADNNLINTSSVEHSKALVECGANPYHIMLPIYDFYGNIVTYEKRVPLIECIDHDEVVEYLLSIGVSPFIEDKNETEAIEIALICGSSKVVGLFVEKLMEDPDYNLINKYFIYMIRHTQSMQGTRYSLLDKVKHFIAIGIDVNCQNENGISPLMILVRRKGVGDIIQLLLDYGADIDQKDSKNRSILTRVLLQKNLVLYDYIIQLGAKETKKHKDHYIQLVQENLEHKRLQKAKEKPLMSDKERRTSGVDSVVRLTNIHTEK
ncbi:Ankyrin repeats (3 copies) [compost metagenome]